MTTEFEPYPAPLDALNALDLDESNFLETVDDRTLGITETGIPALIRIATDRRFDTAMRPAAWAPVHACRALGELGNLAVVAEYLADTNGHCGAEWVDDFAPAAGAPADVARNGARRLPGRSRRSCECAARSFWSAGPSSRRLSAYNGPRSASTPGASRSRCRPTRWNREDVDRPVRFRAAG